LSEEDETTPGFISEDENHFIDCISNNDALREYYETLLEGLSCLFLQSKVANDGFLKIDSETASSKALQSAGELIPAVGNLMKGLGLVLEAYNEKEIKKKYKEISNLIPSNM